MTPKHIEENKYKVFGLVGEIDTMYSKNKVMGVPSMVLEMIEKRIFELMDEAYLAGQDSVRECVPEEKPTYESDDLNKLEGLDTLDKYAKLHERVGFNSCREQVLYCISKLQDKNKEV